MTAKIESSEGKTLEARTLELVNWLINTKDENLISSLEKWRVDQKIKKYRDSLKPMTKEELIARADAAEEDIKNGNLISIEDLEKEMENW